MSTAWQKLFPVYVWEVPGAHLALGDGGVHGGAGVTGYLIGSAAAFGGRRGQRALQFGYIRFAHFAAAYIFAVIFVLRVIWAFFGNKLLARDLPGAAQHVHAEWWRGLIRPDQALPLPQAARAALAGPQPAGHGGMFFMYVLGTVFMVCTGFALYGEGLGMDSWAYKCSRRGSCRCWATARTCTRCTTWACGT
jgi:Ni/Fe-hydrogenase 1 B-type cytochrome subunit